MVLVGIQNSLGGLYIQKRELQNAEQRFNSSLNLCKNLNYPFGKANALSGLAVVSEHQGRGDFALKYASEALEISKKYGFRLPNESSLRAIVIRLAFSVQEEN